jgi:cytochrome c-type biogenesis protein CcmH
MIGWAIFAALAGVAAVALWLVRRPNRAAWQLIGAALLVAAAGYAWQGRPELFGHPADTAAKKPSATTMVFAAERGEWMDTVGPEADVLASADAWLARGEPDYAIAIVKSYLAKRPGSTMLWLGLGNALVQYADGVVTPAARYAFDRAAALSPQNPAPAYFLGLDYALSGDFDTAAKLWKPILATAPPQAPWRAKLAMRLELLRRLGLPN